MRSLRRRLRVLLVPAVALAAALASSHEVSAEGDASAISYESVPGLYTAAELGLGGRPLYQRLFPSGWPTTKEFRRMTLEEGEGAFADAMGAIMGSGLGVPLDVSTWERFSLEQQKNNARAFGNVPALLADRWKAFRKESNLASEPEAFNPTF